MVLVGRRLLPERASGPAPRPLEGTLDDLAETYALDGKIYRRRVLAGSPLVGASLRDSRLASKYGVTVLGIRSLSKRGPGASRAPALDSRPDPR